MASSRTRKDPRGPLLRFVRDHARVLKQFEIHATRGTYNSILATGLYTKEEVRDHRSGREGGVVELAAMVADRDCEVFIFLSDPLDRVSDAPENRALQRLCKELNVRLINTLAGAEQWALYEAALSIKEWQTRKRKRKTRTPAARAGKSNIDEHGEPTHPTIGDQTLALISHDAKKDEMVAFVNRHHDFLRRYDRILTTGTTGYLIKLLFADSRQVKRIETAARASLEGSPGRFVNLLKDVWLLKLLFCNPDKRSYVEGMAAKSLKGKYDSMKKELVAREERWDSAHAGRRPELTGPAREFVNLITPMASGPKGGDVLIAKEVLNHHCHAIVFFQDPGTAQPHEPDIRLFERTCQFWPEDGIEAVGDASSGAPKPDSLGESRSVGDSAERVKVRQTYATCVSDFESADKWASRMKRVASSPGYQPPLAHILRTYGLRDVVIVESESEADTQELGRVLTRACAGYLHRRILTTAREGKTTRIGIGYGWTQLELLNQLHQMRDKEGLLDGRSTPKGDLIWSPLIANLPTVFTELEASVIANRFQAFYGAGRLESFQGSSMIRTGSSNTTLPKEDLDLITNLSNADLIITSGARWNPKAPVFRILDPAAMKRLELQRVVGTVSLIFLNRKGREVRWDYSPIGLDYKGFQQAAKRGAVILICGGESRKEIALAALRGKLVSVLVTTRKTAEYLVKELRRNQL